MPTHDPHADTRECLGKPVAGEPGAPPLFLDAPFPPYRFVPGKAPHPFAHKEGYGYGKPRPAPPFLHAERWRENQAYLRGIDFFNRGWWWEAHEAWEDLWHVVEGRDDQQHKLLKALIQLAACALNRERGVDGGAQRLLSSSTAFLDIHAEQPARLLGLDRAALSTAATQALGNPVHCVSSFFLVPL